MKRNLLVILFVVGMLASCGGGQSNSTVSESQAKLFQQVFTIDTARNAYRSTIDLGRLKSGESVIYTVGLVNPDSAAMVILDVNATCACSHVDYDQNPILPGDTAYLKIHYDASGQFGSQTKLIQLTTSLSRRPYNIYIKSEVEPRK